LHNVVFGVHLPTVRDAREVCREVSGSVREKAVERRGREVNNPAGSALAALRGSEFGSGHPASGGAGTLADQAADGGFY